MFRGVRMACQSAERASNTCSFDPKEDQLATTRQEIKQIVEAALDALDLDYSVFDILQGNGQVDSWKITFFDRGPADGQRIFDISVLGRRDSSDQMLKEAIVCQLSNRLARRPPGATDERSI